MSAILECILNGCWEDDSDDEDANERDTVAAPNHPGHMERMNMNALLYYQPPHVAATSEEQPVQTRSRLHQQHQQNQQNQHQQNQEGDTFGQDLSRNISGLFQAIGQRVHKLNRNRGQFNPLSQTPPPMSPICHECDSGSEMASASLVSAHDFIEDTDVSSDEIIPSIQENQFVMPGSDLQKQMSLNLQAKGFGILGNGEEECVICMESFDETNPRMPTLCGCGENNTYFHLPCLYQWIEKDLNCPTCRQKLRWEEF